MARDLTKGSIFQNIIAFAGPYLIACFLQTFYPIVDLLIVGAYNNADAISAVSIGGQVMHFVVMVIAGIAMGANVSIAHAFGQKSNEALEKSIGNSILVFAGIGVLMTLLAVGFCEPAARLLQTPVEALDAAISYMWICFLGIPLIVAYNAISSIYRGVGDTFHPLIFVAAGGVFNIILDYILIGVCHLGVEGAAIATVVAQGVSVLAGLLFIRRLKIGVRLSKKMLQPHLPTMKSILQTGVPICCQDGFVQVGFLVITAIANARGLYVSAAVGIVEKIICFFFLVPSAMLASVSAIAAQNRGAGFHARAREALWDTIIICVVYGGIVGLICQPLSPWLVGLFTRESEVIRLGAQYLMTYSVDTGIAGVHFCFSGYFCAYNKSIWSFIHNVLSVMLVRIPGMLITSIVFPLTLYEMGAVTPLGSAFSILICVLVYRCHARRGAWKLA